MKYLTSILFIVAIICLFSFRLVAVEADWNDFYWEKIIVTPSNIDDGSYWLEFYFLPDNPKYGFACGQNSKNPGYGWGGSGVFAKTTDSGRTWQASIIDPQNTSFHAESVIFVDPMIGYVSGPGNIYKTIDGGRTWNKLDMISNYSWGCYAIGNKFWIAAGSCVANLQKIFISENAGESFIRPVSIPNSWFHHITDFKMYDADRLGYCIGSGQIFRTLDGGSSWTLLNSTPAINWQGGGTEVNWHEDLNIYGRSIIIPMSPGCGGGDGPQGAIGFSTDLGATWNVFMTPGQMFGTFILDETSGWACGYNNSIYWTKDAGESWTNLTCGLNGNIHFDDIWFINDTTGFVGGGGGIYKLKHKQISSIDITGDTVKCGDTTAVLIATHFSDASYQWYEVKPGSDAIRIGDNSNTITVNSNGTYYVEIVKNNVPCDRNVSNTVQIYMNESDGPVIEFNKPNYTFCRGIGELLSITNSNSNWATIKWYLGDKLIDSNKTTLIPAESGQYRVEVRTTHGNCLLESNSIELTITGGQDVLDITENELPLFVDSVKYGKQSYRSFRITNHGDTTITLRNIGFQQKMAFTVPMWQFPLTIPPGYSHDVIVYYTPTDINLQTDSLYIEDYCSTHTWYVSGFGLKNFDTTVGLCDVGVAITTHSIKKSIQVFLPYPNPVDLQQGFGKISLNIITESANGGQVADMPGHSQLPSLRFYNSLGQPAAVAWEYKQGASTMSDKQIITAGELQYNLKQLPGGVYFIQVSYYNYNKVFSIVVN